jgi:hypothetical protein
MISTVTPTSSATQLLSAVSLRVRPEGAGVSTELVRQVELCLHNLIRSGHVTVDKTEAGKLYTGTPKCFIERHAGSE